MIKNKLRILGTAVLAVPVLVLLTVVTPTKLLSAPGPGFNPVSDGLVKDFVAYQTFGGKFGTAAKSVTYNVFLPSGFGFNPNSDRLQLSYNFSSGGAVVYDTGNFGGCVASSGGYKCTVTWTFNEFNQSLTAGEYGVQFDVLDSNTKGKGRIFVDIGSGSQHQYIENGYNIFIGDPLTTPYAEFKGALSTSTLSDKTIAKSFPVSVQINKSNKPTSVDFYLDGLLVGSVNESTVETDNRFDSGKLMLFSYNFTDFDTLSNGMHYITAVANGAGYSSTVKTPDGQSNIIVAVAFSNDPACNTKIKAMGELTLSIIENETAQLKTIETIDAKVRQYFVDNPSELSNYGELITIADNSNKLAYTTLANLVKSNNFECSDLSSGIDKFITQIDKVYQSLVDYRNAVIGIIDEVGGK